MPEIYEIKTRIEGLKSIHNITYAMQIVTISRLKRITAQLLRLKDSFSEVSRILGYLLSENQKLKDKFFNQESNQDLPPVLVMFFSNRGFCGSFNQDVVNKAIQWCSQEGIAYESVEKICVGKKGSVVVKDPKATFIVPTKDLFSKEDGEVLFEKVNALIQQKRKIYCVYFQFKSIVSQKVVLDSYYPPTHEEFETESISLDLGIPRFVDPSKEIAEEKVMDYYYYLKIFKAIRESASSEFSQRFLLMKSAVDNVKELSEELMMELNKERQRMITQEISEIISTFKALQTKK